MIILQMAGGLGNQMFQYALYRQLTAMGKTVKMDDEAGFREDRQRDPALAPFGAAYEKASREEIMRMTDASPAFSARVRRKLFGRHKKSYFEESKRFLPEIFTWDDIYLEGYWQSEKYFPDVGTLIKKDFGLESVRRNAVNGYGLSACAQDYLQQMENTCSVSVHVRRGDYLLPENQALFGHICTEAYYESAMRYLADRHPACTFYLFTNDREWGRDWIDKKTCDIILVELPDEKDYEALTLMSRCKHNILANSSFSWWASYLNENPDKIVAAPAKWMNGWDCTDIYRTDMTIIR